MCWNWLRDKATRRELKYYWAPGKENYADYFTKHFPPNYNQKIRPNHIFTGFNLTTLHPYCGDLASPSHVQGCVFPWAGTNGYKSVITVTTVTHALTQTLLQYNLKTFL